MGFADKYGLSFLSQTFFPQPIFHRKLSLCEAEICHAWLGCGDSEEEGHKKLLSLFLEIGIEVLLKEAMSNC